MMRMDFLEQVKQSLLAMLILSGSISDSNVSRPPVPSSKSGRETYVGVCFWWVRSDVEKGPSREPSDSRRGYCHLRC
jgi:hypothetical protein